MLCRKSSGARNTAILSSFSVNIGKRVSRVKKDIWHGICNRSVKIELLVINLKKIKMIVIML